MEQFIAPRVLKVNGELSPCECSDNIVCAYCVQANLLLFERAEGKSGFIEEADAVARNARKAQKAPQKNPSILALEERIKLTTLRTIGRELGVSHVTITTWIKRGKVPVKYFKNGELLGKEAISEG
jgi:hypothetical protein